MGSLNETPAEIKELFKTDGIRKNLRLVFDNGLTFINKDIVTESLSLTSSISSSDDFSFGGGEANVLEVEIVDCPNVKGEKFTAYLEIYSIDEGSVYRPDLENYVYPLFLGEFIVEDCKKKSGNINIRKIEAYTNAKMFQPLINEINNYRKNNTDGRIRFEASQFLCVADQHIGFKDMMEGSTTTLELSDKEFARIYVPQINKSYSIRVRFRVFTSNGFTYLPNDYYEFNSNSVINTAYQRIENLYGWSQIQYYVSDKQKTNVINSLKAILDNIQNRVVTKTPMYYLKDQYLGIYFPPKAMILSISGERTYEANSVSFGNTDHKAPFVTDDNKSEDINIEIPLPTIGEEDKWLADVRKGFYELQGCIAMANLNYVPHLIEPNLQRSNEVISPELVKELWHDDSARKFGKIIFVWKTKEGSEQTFTWQMYNTQYLNIYSEIEKTCTIVQVDNEVEIQFDTPCKSNMLFFLFSNLSTHSTVAIDIYKDGEKVGQIADYYGNQFYYTDEDIEDEDYQDDFSSGGRVYNDALLGATSIRVRNLDGTKLYARDVDVSNVYDYELEYGATKVEGDTYTVDTSNYLMENAWFNSFNIVHYITLLDKRLRNIVYTPTDATIKGLPYIEVGDSVQINAYNDTVDTIVLRKTMQGIQNLTDNYEIN